jgi:ribonuclease Z
MKAFSRLLLALGFLGALGLGLFQLPAVQDSLFRRAVSEVMTAPTAPFEGLQVVVCGSASPLGNSPNHAQACLAVLTPEHFFLFDVGARAPLRIAQARLPLGRLDGVFLTHFHSDHIAGLPDVNLASWVQGRPAPLMIYGPEGVATVVEGFNAAYALDRGYRVAHHGADTLPPTLGPMAATALAETGVVWADETLTIRAVTVDHDPASPALGYRIDYGGRSVVISGDSNASAALFSLAEGADLLFHDALSRTLLDPMIAQAKAAGLDPLPKIMTDVIDYHADVQSLLAPAKAARVGQLVLYHLVPVPPNGLAERLFRRGLPKEVILAQDLQRFDLPRGQKDILIHAP